MSLRTPRRWLPALAVDRETARFWAILIALEAYLLLAYFWFTPAEPSGQFRYLMYPFVWINAGLWGVRRVAPGPGTRALRAVGGLVAGAYLLVLLYVPGSIGFGSANAAIDVRVAMQAPGWGPLVAFTSPWLRLYLVPFEVLGYVALAYLVYANVLAMGRSTVTGALGFVTCVGCTVPVITPLLGALGGPASGLASTAYAWSYDVGTAIFLLTVGLLAWGARADSRRSGD